MEGMNENDEWKTNLQGDLQKDVLVSDIFIVDKTEQTIEEPVHESFKLNSSGIDLEPIKNFLGFSGGSILYCLSAASIMYGLCRIIGPKLASSVDLGETFPSILAVNLYELALIGVLFSIVVFRNVLDDAISILVLIAVFLITSGLILGTITPGDPKMCIIIGFCCILLGAGKLFILRRYIGLPIAALSFAGIMIILSWNFLATPIMALAFPRGVWVDETRRLQWLVGWLVILIGASLILADAIRSKTQLKRQPAAETPFIRKPAMVWVFVLVLLAGSCFYQRSTGYMFVIERSFGDYLPFISIFALLVVELVACFNKRYMRIAEIAACVPLVLTVLAIFDRNVLAGWGFNIELIWYPPVMLAICCGIILVQAFFLRRQNFYYIAIAYALGVLLTFGYSHGRWNELNWGLCGTGIFVIVLTFGIMKRNIILCFAAVVLLAGGVGMSDVLARFADKNSLTIPGAVTCIAGLGTMAVCLIFAEEKQKGLLAFGAVCLMFTIFDYLSTSLGLKDIGVLVVIAALLSALWLRLNKQALYAMPICVPFIPRMYLFVVAMSSWGFIVLSFVLLILGGAVSFFYKQNLMQVSGAANDGEKSWINESNQ